LDEYYGYWIREKEKKEAKTLTEDNYATRAYKDKRKSLDKESSQNMIQSTHESINMDLPIGGGGKLTGKI